MGAEKSALKRARLVAMPRWVADYADWYCAFALFLMLRIVFSIGAFFILILLQLDPRLLSGPLPLVEPQHSQIWYLVLGVWQRADAAWYAKIATFGYLPFDRAVAFLPLYPLLVRVVGLGHVDLFALSGVIVSGGAFIFAVVGLYRLIKDEHSQSIAQRTVLYITIFPTAFYLFTSYAEALFFALIIWTFRFARQGRWGWTWLLACLVALTRPPGFLIALPLLWEAFRQWRTQRLHWATMAPVAGPPLCFLAYSEGVRLATGWSYFEAARTWGGVWIAPWTAMARSWSFVVETGNVVELLNLVLTIVFITLTLVGIRTIPFTFTLYSLTQLLPIASRFQLPMPLFSAVRYLLLVFPVFWILAVLLREKRYRLLWIGFSLSMLIILFILFVIPLIIIA